MLYNKTKQVDLPLIILAALCCALGLTLASSMEYIGAAESFTSGSVKGLFFTQLTALLIGVIGCAVIKTMGTIRLMRYALPIELTGFFMTALTLTPLGISPAGSDDKAWLRLGGFSIQPAEILKLCFLIGFTAHIERVRERLNSPLALLLLLMHAAAPVVLIWLQGDQGTALIFIAVSLAMLIAGGLDFRLLISGLMLSPLLIWFAWRFLMQEHQRSRLMILLDPSQDPLGAGFQQAQAQLAIARGGLWGNGLFSREAELVYVSQSQNDFVFSYAGQVGGLVLCAATVILQFALVLRIAVTAGRSAGPRKIAGAGAAAMFFTHTFINISMVLGFMPVVGVPLPFISAGGTAMTVMLWVLGLVI